MDLRLGVCAFCAFITASLFALLVCAAESIKVANAWVRAPAAGQTTLSAYADLTSDRDAAVVAAGSPIASRVELHSSTVEGGVMRMRALPRIDLPAGQTVKLAPNGTHIMLIGVKQPVKPGDKLPIVLSVQPPGPAAGTSLTTVTFEAEVRAAAATSHKH
jgi:periplasmic copper chaperone A